MADGSKLLTGNSVLFYISNNNLYGRSNINVSNIVPISSKRLQITLGTG